MHAIAYRRPPPNPRACHGWATHRLHNPSWCSWVKYDERKTDPQDETPSSYERLNGAQVSRLSTKSRDGDGSSERVWVRAGDRQPATCLRHGWAEHAPPPNLRMPVGSLRLSAKPHNSHAPGEYIRTTAQRNDAYSTLYNFHQSSGEISKIESRHYVPARYRQHRCSCGRKFNATQSGRPSFGIRQQSNDDDSSAVARPVFRPPGSYLIGG